MLKTDDANISICTKCITKLADISVKSVIEMFDGLFVKKSHLIKFKNKTTKQNKFKTLWLKLPNKSMKTSTFQAKDQIF